MMVKRKGDQTYQCTERNCASRNQHKTLAEHSDIKVTGLDMCVKSPCHGR